MDLQAEPTREAFYEGYLHARTRGSFGDRRIGKMRRSVTGWHALSAGDGRGARCAAGRIAGSIEPRQERSTAGKRRGRVGADDCLRTRTASTGDHVRLKRSPELSVATGARIRLRGRPHPSPGSAGQTV